MNINQIVGSEFIITKSKIIGIRNGKIDSMAGICKAKDFHNQGKDLTHPQQVNRHSIPSFDFNILGLRRCD